MTLIGIFLVWFGFMLTIVGLSHQVVPGAGLRVTPWYIVGGMFFIGALVLAYWQAT